MYATEAAVTLTGDSPQFGEGREREGKREKGKILDLGEEVD